MVIASRAGSNPAPATHGGVAQLVEATLEPPHNQIITPALVFTVERQIERVRSVSSDASAIPARSANTSWAGSLKEKHDVFRNEPLTSTCWRAQMDGKTRPGTGYVPGLTLSLGD
ncbi:MAG TPA: hypothetical protein VHV10_04485 [Ktedonobacteraceae bacterium]|nr:hypothetical protein [Ktedonobacteraceae bacterium]